MEVIHLLRARLDKDKTLSLLTYWVCFMEKTEADLASRDSLEPISESPERTFESV